MSQDMHIVRRDVIEQPLIVRDEHKCAFGASQRIHAARHDL